MKHYEIDASGKSLGRLATQIASLLRGKTRVDYTPHLDPMTTVRVFNFSKIVLTGRKSSQKIYYHYTGYHGGLKKRKYAELAKKDAGRPLKTAVLRMLNKNRLRAKLMKRLTIEQ